MYVANRLDFKYVATSYLIACAAVHQWNIYIYQELIFLKVIEKIKNITHPFIHSSVCATKADNNGFQLGYYHSYVYTAVLQ